MPILLTTKTLTFSNPILSDVLILPQPNQRQIVPNLARFRNLSLNLQAQKHAKKQN